MVEDAKELKEVLSVVSTEIPKLLKALSETLFGSEQTANYAKAVADFYKSLREAEMEEGQAFELTKQFMNKTNFAAMIKEFIGKKGGPGKGIEIDQDIGSSIEEAVKEKIKEKFKEKGLESDEE
ncbi:MAG: hypothetical protein V3U52_05915 [Thermoplasmata archaeon]